MRWQRLGEAARTLARRRSARLTAAGVAVLVVLALTWVAAVASISTVSTVSTAGGPTGSAGLPTAPAVAADSSAGSPGSSAGSSDTAAAPAPEAKRIAPPGPGDPGLPVDVSGAARDRSVVRNARLELSVGDVAAVSGRLRSVAAGVGGFVASEQSVDRSASFTLRIPAPRLDEVMNQLTAAGKVTARSEQADDVTDQVADLDGRLASQRAGVARIRALLDKATSVGDVVLIESELTQREADLESLQKRLAAVSSQVAMSTLTVALTPTPAPEAQPAGDGFLAGLAAGWRAFVTASGALLTALGAVLPFALLLALLGGLVLLGRRLLLQRSRRSGHQPAATPDTP
ncbi:MAG: hypothetical protein QOE32_7762 [Pseudonocardiales bacterium]|nr:hypothetical protein [Pseudonocardiales bacterium]